MELNDIKKIAVEKLYEDEIFLDELRKKYGEIKGLKILRKLEKKVGIEAEKLTSIPEDLIVSNIEKIIQNIKKEERKLS